jgi:hypothetical protein
MFLTIFVANKSTPHLASFALTAAPAKKHYANKECKAK